MSHLLALSDAIAAHARLHPGKIGTRDSQRALTFAAMERARQPARQRASRPRPDQGRSRRLLAYNCVEWMEIYVALARAGLVAVPINFRLVAPEIDYIADALRSARVHRAGRPRRPRRADPRRARRSPPSAGSTSARATPAGWPSYEALIAARLDGDARGAREAGGHRGR